MRQPSHALLAAAFAAQQLPWMPWMGSRQRTPGRHNKRAKSYPGGFNKSRECARRRRQMGLDA